MRIGAMTAATALLITCDESLLEEVLRLTAAAGVDLDVAHDSAAAVRGWVAAPVVLVGADQLSAIARQHPVRRDQVHVISTTPAPDDLFRMALEVGAENVVELPSAETWLVELLTDVADGGARRATTIGVIGGSGGAGATTFAAALAMTAAQDQQKVLLIDADPFGGGIDRVAGLEDLDGIRWASLAHTTGRFSSRSLREALPQRDGLAVLTWASGPHCRTEANAVREVLSAALRGSDTVVVDLPRHPDPMTTEVLSRCDHVVLVAGLTVPAVAAASRVAAYLHDSACTWSPGAARPRSRPRTCLAPSVSRSPRRWPTRGDLPSPSTSDSVRSKHAADRWPEPRPPCSVASASPCRG